MRRGLARSSSFSLLDSAAIQIRVLNALVIREALTRYGHDNLGFFWVFAEPIMLAFMVMIMWSFTTHGQVDQIGIIPFVLTGYSALTLWRHTLSGSVRAMRRRASLLFHRNVKPFDIIMAMVTLEIIGVFAAFVVAFIPLWILGFVPTPHDPLLTLGGWLLLGWFSLSVGMVLAAASELAEPVEHFVQPLMYVTIPLTGTFYLIDWMPQRAQEVLLYSPLVNCMEMFRAGIFIPDTHLHYSAGYVAICCFVLTAIGFPLMVYAQRHVEHY